MVKTDGTYHVLEVDLTDPEVQSILDEIEVTEEMILAGTAVIQTGLVEEPSGGDTIYAEEIFRIMRATQLGLIRP